MAGYRLTIVTKTITELMMQRWLMMKVKLSKLAHLVVTMAGSDLKSAQLIKLHGAKKTLP
jgi:hypothetical protein